ncbi:MAG: ATP-binding protein [Bacteroidales bacterium]|nr:ATP-binding protein [Bacteroidales bacterium]
MNEKFIARERECTELDRCLNSNRSELVIIYGRRRVGKTYLIDEFFDNKFDFKYVGARNQKKRTLLQNFSRTLKRFSGKSIGRLDTWSDAFYALENYLESLPKDRKKIIFFDEMPWMDTRRSDFVSALEYFWNSWAASRNDIMLVATGSATSWMVDKLIDNKGGLHARVTSRIHVEPFTLKEVEQYLKGIGARWDRFQILQSYMLLGGVPFYYRQINPKESLAQNVDRLFFRPDGVLRVEFDELFPALFENVGLYTSIVKTLSANKSGLTNKEISKKIKLEGGKLTRALKNLERCDFIEKWSQYGMSKRETTYRLVDFFTHFYYQFVEANNTRDEYWWTHNINSKSISSWMGITFELICMRHHPQIKQALGIADRGTSISSWHQIGDGQQTRGAQIDFIIERDDRMIHLCEMKFSTGKYVIDNEYEERLLNREALFRQATKIKKATVHTFVTTYGVVDGKHKSIVHSEVTMPDLFK